MPCHLESDRACLSNSHLFPLSYTAFLLSVRRGYLNSAKRLAVFGADMNCRTKNGLDSIALAFEFPRTKDWLQSVRDYTPLHVAINLHSTRHSKRLLREGELLSCQASYTISCGGCLYLSPDSTLIAPSHSRCQPP